MKYQVNKIAVLGAGVMGSAIAAHFAGAGFKVLLLDMVPNILTDEEKSKKLTLNHEVIRNKLANLGKANILNPKSKAIYAKDLGDLIETGNFIDDMGKISDCDLIMEVIVENLDIKRDLMKVIAKYRKEGTIVATRSEERR